MDFSITSLKAARGELGISPAPGRFGAYSDDLAEILGWRPQLVLTMTENAELARLGAGSLREDLLAAGIGWEHLPVRDFGSPEGATLKQWPQSAARARAELHAGARVLVHCFGGCGRSGMAILRLLVEMGEAPDTALARLRKLRPCAVETEAQLAWACTPEL